MRLPSTPIPYQVIASIQTWFVRKKRWYLYAAMFRWTMYALHRMSREVGEISNELGLHIQVSGICRQICS